MAREDGRHLRQRALQDQQRLEAFVAEAAQPFADVLISYQVPLIPQTGPTCWAASMAMILSYRLGQTIDPATIVKVAQQGGAAAQIFKWVRGKLPWISSEAYLSNDDLVRVLALFGFCEVPLPHVTFVPTARQWYDWLVAYGPLWVDVQYGAPALRPKEDHAVVVNAVWGDVRDPHQSGGDGNRASIEFLNPWGRRERQAPTTFGEMFGNGRVTPLRIYYHPGPPAQSGAVVRRDRFGRPMRG